MPEIKPQSVEQQTDPFLFRLVVGILGAAVIITLIGGFVLAAMGIEVPGALIAIGAAAGGGLGMLLAPSPVK